MGVGVGINGKGYVGMGDTKNLNNQGPPTSNLLFEYNPLTNTWAQKSNATTGVELGAVAVLNDEMYVFGGTVEDNRRIDNMQKYDPKADKWHTLNNETGGNRMDAAGFYADGKIYVGGGTDSEYLNDFYEYNLSTNQWTQKKNFGSYHAQRAAVEIDGKGYFVGGYYKNSTFNWNAQFLDSLLVYDPSSDTWEGKRAFPGGRRYNMMAVKHKGKLYAGMGIDLDGYFRTDFYEYDPNTNKWTVKASVPDLGVAKPRYNNAGYYVIGDTLYLYTDRYEFKYEFENNSWQVGELPNDIKSALYNKTFTTNNAFAYNGKGYLKHVDPSGKIDVLSEYDPTLGTWSPYKNNLPFQSMFSTIIPTPEGVFFGFGIDEEYRMISNQWRKLSINAGLSTKIGEYNLEKNSGCGIDNFYGKIVATVSDEDGKLFASLTRNDFYGNLCIKTISKDTSLPYQESTGLYGKDYLEDVMVLHKGLVVSANFDKRVLLKMYYTTNELNNLVQKFNTKYGTSKTIDSLDILMYNALDAIDNNIKNNKYTTYKELGFSVSSYGSDKLVTIETSDNMKGEMYLVLKKPAVKTDVEENFVDFVKIKPYPNPTKETLYFSKYVQYQITDAYGKPIKQGEGTEANVSELAVGLYFISINGRSNKFIKE
ncbi:MAG TPA: hypothetical protein DCR46_00835 [Cytophagales bacterium]|nr:hypothetical protein [Cytophagales bacterium]